MCNLNAPILVVEDEAADAMLFRRSLQKIGVSQAPVVVEDGEEAVRYLEGSGKYSDRQKYPLPSIVVLDIKLPRKSGFEVLEWIRDRMDQLRHIPVVMLSSSNMGRDVAVAYDKGANSYVTKPATSADYTRMATAFASFWMNYNEQAGCPRMVGSDAYAIGER